MVRKQAIADEFDISLAEWLEMSQSQCDERLVFYCTFLSDQHRNEYLESIELRSEKDIKALLRRLLMPSGFLPQNDRFRLPSAVANFKRMGEDHFESDARLLRFVLSKGQTPPPWEGITWILDLLPQSPREALQVLDSYFQVHCLILPDGRLLGLSDAMMIIRAKYIGTPESNKEKVIFLNSLTPRHFECVVAHLFKEMGYVVILTPEWRDGGKDILAKGVGVGKKERVLIECKRHSNPVGVEYARALLGVVEDEKANKGILIATQGFTKGAKKLAESNGRLELVDGPHLYCLLNEHLGSRWHLSIERIVNASSSFGQSEDLDQREGISIL